MAISIGELEEAAAGGWRAPEEAALGRWRLRAAAAGRGMTGLYLQVDKDNSSARSLYRRVGFADHHGYHYRIAPAAPRPERTGRTLAGEKEFLMARVIAFDVNETLLDLSALDEPFEALFGSPALRPQWFALMLQLSFVGGLTGRYVDFGAAQRAALAMLAEREGVPVSPGDIEALPVVGQIIATDG
jgi:hypothetical protein